MQNNKKKLLYFHSGGLITGHKNDYPPKYIKQFEELNYEFIGYDYPLTPYTDLSDIIGSCLEFVKLYVDDDYVLFGRSAGAYLVIQTLQQLFNLNLKLPQKVILFYGYENFSNPKFFMPKKYPIQIKKSEIENFISQKTSSDPLFHRSLLYLYGRQEGLWPELIKDENNLKFKSASVLETEFMPSTFIAHSSSDEDVPYIESKKLNQKITDSIFHTVYYKSHEFDLDICDPDSIKIMNSLFDWLSK